MTDEHAGEGCVDLPFVEAHAVGASGLEALEDYARAVTISRDARALVADPAPLRVAGIHLCAPAGGLTGAQRADVEAFARGLAERSGEGLGWS